MGSRIFVGGRPVAFSLGYRPQPPTPAVDLDGSGRILDLSPIPPDSPDSPMRAGVAYRDPDTGMVLRIVERLRIEEGWGTSRFWCDRYCVPFSALLEWVELGLMDAAMERGSPTKRFRCRDETRILDWIARKHHRYLPEKLRRQAERR
jgi:hypothetical protein